MSSSNRQDPPRHGRDHLHVERRMEGAAVVVRVAGDVDMVTAPLLCEQLEIATALATPPAPVIADLRDVEFFGSSGISALLETARRCDQQRITLRLLATRPVTRPLDLLGVQSSFTLFSTLNEALITAR